MKKRAAFLLLIGLCLILGCGQTSLVTKPPATIVITPSSGAMVAYSRYTFTARGYDSDGHEVPFVASSWAPYPWDLGKMTDYGVSDGKPFAVFEPRSMATGEVRCVYNDVRAHADVTCYATVERVAISPTNYPSPLKVTMGLNQTFTARVWVETDSGEREITLFTPEWTPFGSVVTLLTAEGATATFQPTNIGYGSIEAIVGGVTGEVIISVEASS